MRLRYDNAMKSPEYERFENLLRRVVSVPHSEVKRRMEADQAANDLVREDARPVSRKRPIVSPAAVSGARSAKRP